MDLRDRPADSIRPGQSRRNTKNTPLENSQYDRLKGAQWFHEARNRNVVIVGAGGIGSWACLLHSRIGSIINIFDHDSYEAHNLSGQLARKMDIGKSKCSAISEICQMFSSTPIYGNTERYTSSSFSNDIVICGLDNMDARRIAFERWTRNAPSYGSFFQDGRLNAEQFQIFNIPGHRKDLIELYRKEYLFDDSEVEEADCTFKQTSHCAAMIASHMIGFYTNWLRNAKNYFTPKMVENPDVPTYIWEDEFPTPFKFEYVIPFNLSTSDYVKS
jgi:hypothetical protein